MNQINSLNYTIVFFLIIGILMYGISLIERYVLRSKYLISINPIIFLNEIKYLNKSIIKRIFQQEKEQIDLFNVLNILLKILIFSLIINFIPFNGESLIKLDNNFFNNTFAIKSIMTLNILIGITAKNNFHSSDVYKLINYKLNSLIIILFNFLIIDSFEQHNLIIKYFGCFLSILAIILLEFRPFVLKKTIQRIILKLDKLIWYTFLIGIFLNLGYYTKKIDIFILCLIVGVLFLGWINSLIKKLSVKYNNQVLQNKIIYICIIISLINYIVLEIYDYL